MTIFILAYLIGGYCAMAAAWFLGGRPERWGAVIWAVNWLLAGVVLDLRSGSLLIGHAMSDGVSLAGMIWLALRYDRWWILASVASMTLWMTVHLSALLNPQLSYIGIVSALLGFSLLGVLLLGLGVLERWLAGERRVEVLERWLP